MVKQFILLLQLIGVFIYQTVLIGDVTVTQVVPSSISSETDQLIEIHVAKGTTSGFAKVQQDVPAGFSIEPVETKGATFSYKDNRIKFIWMALPAEEEFTISYKIKANPGTTGEFTLGGKFSFIADSERQNVPIAESKFSITEQILAEETTEEEVTEEVVEEIREEIVEETLEEVVAETVEEESTETQEVAEETTESTEETTEVAEEVAAVSVSSKRMVSDNGDGSYNVKLTITQTGIEGFAKVTEEIPEGFIAEDVNPSGGVFSFKDGSVKILWMAIPKDNEIVVDYFVRAKTAANGTYSVKGAFAYLENDITQKYDLESSSFTLNQEVIAEVVEETTETEEVVAEEVVEENTETSLEEKVNEEIAETTEEETSTEETTEAITSIPNPETGVSYKIQVGAGHQTIPENWFATKFNLRDNINTENHEGWIKYVVGSFNEYKAARDKRNTVRNNVKRAFVTAYNSGQRITVQEALMISNQKWYK